METINDIAREVAAEMLNTSMQDITAERIHGWATRLGDAATCEKSSQVGNAAAMREALEKIIKQVDEVDKCVNADISYLKAFTNHIQQTAMLALSAPARNCDLYKSEPEAYRAYLTAMKNATKKTYVYFEPWLFAEAKGE